MAFHPDHTIELKVKSGLTDETIQMMGVYSVPPADIGKILGFTPSKMTSALAFPYPGCDGFIRVKTFPPFEDKNGHLIKYLQPKGSVTHLYILPVVEKVLKDSSVPIAIAEGEKKTGALLQIGILTVGVAGIWSWVNGNTHEPIQEINQIAWVDREVTFYFDSDIWHRPDLLKAVYALGKELEERGALVKVVQIEQKGQEKIGVDDFLIANGAQALETLKSIPLSHKAFGQAQKWWKGWKGRKRIAVTNTTQTNLKSVISEIRKIPRETLASFERKRLISDVVIKRLLEGGDIYVTPEKDGFFFNRETRTLCPIESKDLQRFLADETGLNPTETEFRFVFEDLLTEADRRGKVTQVHHLSHYDAFSHRLHITNFAGGIYLLDGQSVSLARNGEGDVLFVTNSLATPFTYIPVDKRIANVRSFIEPINFDTTSNLSQEELRFLFFVYLLSIFFPELLPTKPVPVFIGPNGSTKTTTARRLGIQIIGKNFNVGHLESAERGEQAFIASICSKPFVAYDNADTLIKWLPDRLATFATGNLFEFRKLYTTNESSTYKPIAHLVLTSRDPHFRRPDVAERLLILKLTRPEKFVPESEVLAKTLEERDSVWSDLLDILNRALVSLREVPKAPPLEFRMADFASFGWRLSMAQGQEKATELFCQSLKKLEAEQAKYATEEDAVASCLAVWLQDPANLDREIESGPLYTALGAIAKEQGLMLPKTSASMGKKLRLARKALELALEIRIRIRPTTHTSHWLFTKPCVETEKFPETTHPTHLAQPEVVTHGGQEVQEGQNKETS